MIRSALSLLAKKTAIVAVSGVVVIGGAGFALAEIGDEAPDTSCDDTETTEVVEACEVDEDTTTTTEVDETTTTTEAEDTTTTSEPEEGDDADEVEAPEATATLDATADDDLEGEEVEGDSHGAMVSEAARVTCWEDNYLDLYGNHGQCVRTFAHGEGLTTEEVDEAIAARDAEQAAKDDASTVDTTETETADVQQAESSKPGKGQGNGGGKGNGKGKKG